MWDSGRSTLNMMGHDTMTAVGGRYYYQRVSSGAPYRRAVRSPTGPDSDNVVAVYRDMHVTQTTLLPHIICVPSIVFRFACG